jgi:D-threo-aldose 1-dehydrogenase
MTAQDRTSLPKRQMARSGVQVTEIGFGSAPIGNFRFNATDDEAHDAMAALWEGGGRYYDTSPFYGYGRSELRVGRFLRSVDPNQYVLSTKIGRWMRPVRAGDDTSGLRTGGLPFFPTFDVSYDGTMRSLEQSYLRTGLDRIDIALIHDVDAFTHGSDAAAEPLFEAAMNGAYRALTELRRTGEIKAIGAGINDTRWCRRFVEAGDFDCMMLAGQYTLLEHSIETLAFFDVCRKKKIGLLMAGVFNSGLLAGGSKSGAAFHYKPPSPEILARVAQMEAICARHGVSLNAAAMQFVLAEPLVKSLALGATTPEEVRANLAAYRLEIPAPFWSELEDAGLLGKDLPVPPTAA